jgi:hypothetical protein
VKDFEWEDGKQGRILCVEHRQNLLEEMFNGMTLISTHSPEGTHIPILQFYRIDVGEFGAYSTHRVRG